MLLCCQCDIEDPVILHIKLFKPRHKICSITPQLLRNVSQWKYLQIFAKLLIMWKPLTNTRTTQSTDKINRVFNLKIPNCFYCFDTEIYLISSTCDVIETVLCTQYLGNKNSHLTLLLSPELVTLSIIFVITEYRCSQCDRVKINNVCSVAAIILNYQHWTQRVKYQNLNLNKYPGPAHLVTTGDSDKSC